jgi:hypothetical protein
MYLPVRGLPSMLVELDGDNLSQVVHICEPYVSLVGPGMDGDAVGTGFDDGFGRVRYARYPDISLVAQQRDFVQVDAEFGHFFEPLTARTIISLRRFTASI